MIEIQHDSLDHRFVARVGEDEAFLSYTLGSPGKVDFESTYVPPALRGKGLGELIVRQALDWARAEKLQVVPSCWFVGRVVQQRPEYLDLLSRG